MEMEDHFSWSDSLRATVSCCFPCLQSNSDAESNSDGNGNSAFIGVRGVPRARPNELEGLLADAGDLDNEAETLSLHSNIGAGEQRRRRKRGLKKISFFGWNLFGTPPIQLPLEDEDTLSRRPRRTPPTLSSSTLDSDAAPLDPSTIEHMRISSAELDARAAAAEEEDNRLKEERKQLRRERKELQRAARALALAAEGQSQSQSSYTDSQYQQIPSPFLQQSDQPTPTPPLPGRSGSRLTGIAAFFTGANLAVDSDGDSDNADLGGQLYSRKIASPSNSNGGSDSRSRTSASQSNPDRLGYNLNQQLLPHQVPLPRSARSDSISNRSDPVVRPRKKQSSGSKSASSRRSDSSSQSPSLASPIHTSFGLTSPGVASPLSHGGEFEGFPVDSGEGLGGFPSVGLGVARGKGREMGAFLADRGTADV